MHISSRGHYTLHVDNAIFGTGATGSIWNPKALVLPLSEVVLVFFSNNITRLSLL